MGSESNVNIANKLRLYINSGRNGSIEVCWKYGGSRIRDLAWKDK
jgi:hypothetical protein